jgi:hypothetical protein
VLSPSSFEFSMGGSGSCPPDVTSASVVRDTLVVPVTAGSGGCTLDLVYYTVVVTLDQPVLAENTIAWLRTGYSQPGTRVRLVHA